MREDLTLQTQPSLRDRYKWWFLLLIVISKFQAFFNVASLNTLQVQFQQTIAMSEMEFSRIAAMQGIPGLVLPIFMGMLADYYGAWVCVGIFMIAGILGQILICIGIWTVSYWCILIGFVIEFAGVEIGVLGYHIINRAWYKDNELARVNSIMWILITVAAFISDIVYPNLYQLADSLELPYLVGLGIAIFSGVAGVLVLMIHQKMRNLQQIAAPKSEGRKQFSWKYITSLPKTYWILILSFSLGLVSFRASTLYESKFLQTRFHYSVGTAGVMLSIGLACAVIVNPIAGVWMDKVGRLPLFMIGALGFIVLGTIGNVVIPSCDRCFLPIVPLVTMSFPCGVIGIVNSSAVMRLVDPKNLGTSFAVLSTVYSIIQIIILEINGFIAETTYEEWGYQWVFALNVCIGSIALVFAVIMHVIDLRGKQKLQYVMSALHESSIIAPISESLIDTTISKTQVVCDDSAGNVSNQIPLLGDS